MNQLHKISLAVALCCAAVFAPHAARASCGSLPYTFVNGPGASGSTVDANTTNANNQFLQQCATSVDNTQIGPAGIYASQIIPTTLAQATFGGAFGYAFNNTVTAQASAGATPGPVVIAQPTAAPTMQPGNISVGGFVVAGGTVRVGGSSATQGEAFFTSGSSAYIDYGITNPGAWAFHGGGIVINNGSVAASSNNGGAISYVPPIYSPAGTQLAGTMHGVLSSCSIVSSGSCTITFSNAAVFSSQTSYACSASSTANIFATVELMNISSTQIGVFTNTTGTIVVLCVGT